MQIEKAIVARRAAADASAMVWLIAGIGAVGTEDIELTIAVVYGYAVWRCKAPFQPPNHFVRVVIDNIYRAE